MTRLTVLGEIAFTTRIINFGTFRIQQFSKEELDVLTEQETCKIFYPSDKIDTTRLSDFFFLVEDNYQDTMPENESPKNDLDWSRIKIPIPDRIVQLLAMHRWTPNVDDSFFESFMITKDELLGVWSGFGIFDSFVVIHCLMAEPFSASASSTWPMKVPWNIHVGKRQESEIKTTVEQGRKLLRVVEKVKPNWDFVENAMAYIGKATLAKPDLEQLLWNVTVLDCLLCDKEEVRGSIRRRIGNILGFTDQKRKEVRKEFDELYDFRSHLVHGNSFKPIVKFRHLAAARDLARRVMLWFVEYLLWVDTDFREREISYEHYPRRDELLVSIGFRQTVTE